MWDRHYYNSRDDKKDTTYDYIVIFIRNCRHFVKNKFDLIKIVHLCMQKKFIHSEFYANVFLLTILRDADGLIVCIQFVVCLPHISKKNSDT